MNNEQGFFKITNKDIYCEILELKKDLSLINSKVRTNAWIATTAITLSILAMGGIMGVIFK
jgi:hypothetical protein